MAAASSSSSDGVLTTTSPSKTSNRIPAKVVTDKDLEAIAAFPTKLRGPLLENATVKYADTEADLVKYAAHQDEEHPLVVVVNTDEQTGVPGKVLWRFLPRKTDEFTVSDDQATDVDGNPRPMTFLFPNTMQSRWMGIVEPNCGCTPMTLLDSAHVREGLGNYLSAQYRRERLKWYGERLADPSINKDQRAAVEKSKEGFMKLINETKVEDDHYDVKYSPLAIHSKDVYRRGDQPTYISQGFARFLRVLMAASAFNMYALMQSDVDSKMNLTKTKEEDKVNPTPKTFVDKLKPKYQELLSHQPIDVQRLAIGAAMIFEDKWMKIPITYTKDADIEADAERLIEYRKSLHRALFEAKTYDAVLDICEGVYLGVQKNGHGTIVESRRGVWKSATASQIVTNMVRPSPLLPNWRNDARLMRLQRLVEPPNDATVLEMMKKNKDKTKFYYIRPLLLLDMWADDPSAVYSFSQTTLAPKDFGYGVTSMFNSYDKSKKRHIYRLGTWAFRRQWQNVQNVTTMSSSAQYEPSMKMPAMAPPAEAEQRKAVICMDYSQEDLALVDKMEQEIAQRFHRTVQPTLTSSPPVSSSAPMVTEPVGTDENKDPMQKILDDQKQVDETAAAAKTKNRRGPNKRSRSREPDPPRVTARGKGKSSAKKHKTLEEEQEQLAASQMEDV